MEANESLQPETRSHSIRDRMRRLGHHIHKSVVGVRREQKPNANPSQFAEFIDTPQNIEHPTPSQTIKPFQRTETSPAQSTHTQETATKLDLPASAETLSNADIQAILDQRTAHLTPPEFDPAIGSSGFYGTNETADPEFFRKIKNSEHRPDGYIVGPAQQMFTALELYSDEDPPKGLVFVNIDPNLISNAKEFIGQLKEGKVLLSESGGGRTRAYLPEENQNSDYDSFRGGREQIDTNALTMKHAKLLIRLAKEGKIAAIQQNILDTEVLEAVRDLPDFADSRNVISLSNIGDWIRRIGRNDIMDRQFEHAREHQTWLPDEQVNALWEGKFAPLTNLAVLQTRSQTQNLFIDTSEKRDRNYRQTIRVDIPSSRDYLETVAPPTQLAS